MSLAVGDPKTNIAIVESIRVESKDAGSRMTEHETKHRLKRISGKMPSTAGYGCPIDGIHTGACSGAQFSTEKGKALALKYFQS